MLVLDSTRDGNKKLGIHRLVFEDYYRREADPLARPRPFDIFTRLGVALRPTRSCHPRVFLSTESTQQAGTREREIEEIPCVITYCADARGTSLRVCVGRLSPTHWPPSHFSPDTFCPVLLQQGWFGLDSPSLESRCPAFIVCILMVSMVLMLYVPSRLFFYGNALSFSWESFRRIVLYRHESLFLD